MKIVTFIIINCICSFVFCQKQDYIWLGGTQPYPDRSKADGHILDFNRHKGTPGQQDIRYGFTGYNSSYSDVSGKLLFYSNGCAVMNRFHQVMPNGDSINAGLFFDKLWKDCMYGYPGPQDIMSINDPANPNGYYLFHKHNKYISTQLFTHELKYSYIDMSLDNGRGEVTRKNIFYHPNDDVLYSFFTGIKHSNGSDWWIIQPKINDSLFLTFGVTKNGISEPFTQSTGQYFNYEKSSAGGTAKFSPDGTKYALYTYTDQLHVYDFDRSTGKLSNHRKVIIINPDSLDNENVYFSSVEWSPNSRFIYCSSYLKLHQVDLWETNPQNGVRHIADYDGTINPFPNELFLMAQAPDCKIYMTPKNGSYSLHVINKPDELGRACDFVQNAIKLPNSNSGTLPNFPRFRVDDVDKCDPTISSIFGEDVYYRRDIEIYPSPSYGVYQLRMPEGASDGHIVVTDIHGKIIYQTEINTYEYITEIDITSKPSGNYNIEYYPRINPERVFYGRQVVKI